MRYTLFLHYEERTPEEIGQQEMEAAQAAFATYAAALDAAGVLRAAEVLQPSLASTTVSVRDGALRVQDGPYADTKEQVGGSFVIEVPDLDTAVEWARQAPSAEWGTVEVRPSAIRFVDGAWRQS